MSNIYLGPRQQVLVDIKDLTIVRDLTDMFVKWHTPLNPAKHLVFVIDKDQDMKEYKPRVDRHICLLDQYTVPSKINNWVKKHKITVKQSLNPTKDQLFASLINGKIGIQLTSEAAKVLLTLRPRGLQSLYWPIQQLLDLDLEQPITCEAMMGQWPVKHEIDVFDIFNNLGSIKAILVADKVADNRAWGGLYILEKLCLSKPIYLEYLQILQTQELNALTRLRLFTRICYLHNQGLDVTEVFSW